MPPDRPFSAADRRLRAGRMKQALAAARMARDDAWAAVAATEQRLGAARQELETIERRRELARRIDDTETVAVADRFAATQRESVALLERKLAVQRDEAAFAERTAHEMEAELRALLGGGPVPPTGTAASMPDADALAAEIEGLAPRADDADFGVLDAERRAREAAARLAALKRRMGRDG